MSSSSRPPTSRAARPARTNSLVRHNGHEFGFVLTGTLRVVVGFDEFILGPATRSRSRRPRRTASATRGIEPCVPSGSSEGAGVGLREEVPDDRRQADGPTREDDAAGTKRRNSDRRGQQAMTADVRPRARALVAGSRASAEGTSPAGCSTRGGTSRGLPPAPESRWPHKPGRRRPGGRRSGAAAVRGTAPTHVFYATWSRQADGGRELRVNGRMLRNLLDATAAGRIRAPCRARHRAQALPRAVRGVRQGPARHAVFRRAAAAARTRTSITRRRTSCSRPPSATASPGRVHRPHTLIGWALGNAMNMAVTLAVYAAICRETGRRFGYPGSREQ